ncbi:aminotransferase class V-fold PLP-dependent enzyme [Microbacterium sp. RU33B]|uniref:aminotransferase class V-fold PLP-dependent enzyme n=1 Tax=Microbacterium sp. RU33B TaxID=1907390 RepID=UPI000964825D|nr:aminotransferase class V-fold PLP-dependent enzyme [Microbacterium sp. RU33B]SIT71341.1 Selenocysteine lyase/Cysteine desulfurase [Microbacterium sp. RU33B]
MDLESFQASFDGEPGYLDWAAHGPLSSTVRDEVHADAELLGSGRRAGIDMVRAHVPEAEQLLAELLRADASQIVLQPSTTYGLQQALYGLAGGLLVSQAEFPSLTVTATRAAEALGSLQLQWLEPADGRVTAEVVRDALTDDTRALAVSLVDFRTGYRADLSALRDVIGDRLLIVDAIQGFGVVDADWAAADVVCGNGYKWLRAGRGTGFASFSERALERLAPVLSGFTGVDGDLPVDVVPQPSTSAAAFRVSTPDHLAVARLATALADVRDVGVDIIEREIAARASDVMYFADRYEIPVVTPREPEQRAGIVALAPAPQDAAPLAASLANHGITVTVRSGLVRVAPHVGTGGDTLRLFGDALAAFSSSRVW